MHITTPLSCHGRSYSTPLDQLSPPRKIQHVPNIPEIPVLTLHFPTPICQGTTPRAGNQNSPSIINRSPPKSLYSCWHHRRNLLPNFLSPPPPPPSALKLEAQKNLHAIGPKEVGKMQSFRRFLAALLICSSLLSPATSSDEPTQSSIYEVLKIHGLPMGLLPKGVQNFSLDNSGKFEVHLDHACNAKFENEIHYDMNVSGTLRYGRIDRLSGISAQDLFLWFPVIEIRVDVPSSGLIYFNVGVVSKQFSLSSFETPRDCLAVPGPDLLDGKQIVETISEIQSGKLHRYGLDQDNAARTAL